MPQSLSNVLVHLVFSTKNRQPSIVTNFRNDLHAYIGGTLRNHKCPPIIIGGVEDHVRCLFALSRTITIAQVAEKLKTASNFWAKEKGHDLVWQGGYGAFSVGTREVDQITNYIRNQEEHHKRVDFKTEFLALLNEAGIPYDEKYLWD